MKKIKKVILVQLIIIFIFSSCNSENGIDKVVIKKQKDTISTGLIEKKSFPKIENFQKNITLLYNDSNVSSWWSQSAVTTLDIGNKSMNLGWDFRCEFQFKSKLIGEKIILFWSYVPFNCCDADVIFFNKIKEKGPHKNMPFAEFNIINDSIGYMNYYYKKWVNEINSQPTELDSIFPNIFIRRF